jgi:hypothetical protein
VLHFTTTTCNFFWLALLQLLLSTAAIAHRHRRLLLQRFPLFWRHCSLYTKLQVRKERRNFHFAALSEVGVLLLKICWYATNSVHYLLSQRTICTAISWPLNSYILIKFFLCFTSCFFLLYKHIIINNNNNNVDQSLLHVIRFQPSTPWKFHHLIFEWVLRLLMVLTITLFFWTRSHHFFHLFSFVWI